MAGRGCQNRSGSRCAMNPEFVEQLRGVFDQIQVAGADEPWPTESSADRSLQMGYGPGSFYLDDEAQAELNSLVEELAASALLHGGRHPTELQNLITTACSKALEGAPDA